ncbi:MAG: glycosyltransferase family 2 protein, partial [Actinomycetota bacterium]|nr:glycosyltransferase family 2 protein [Actinomycetota bacterium]
LTTLVAAGVPLIQRDNTGSVVATQSLVRSRGLGVFYRELPDLSAQLRDRALMASLRERVWEQRLDFTFDAHADELVAFFRRVISSRCPRR